MLEKHTIFINGNTIGSDLDIMEVFMNEYALLTYYIKYLKEIRKVSDTTVKHYQEALKYISKYLVEKEKISKTVYEIQDIGELEVIKNYLYSDADFMALDKRGHQMYSAGFNNYFKFASGEGFSNIHNQINALDVEVPASERTSISHSAWRRSSIIKVQSIKSAGYLCEIDNSHKTFMAKASGQQYMEGHHAIPMKKQESFKNSLDVYANVVCLCPICHRLLHYGIDEDKTILIEQIYEDRGDRLAKSGIRLSKSEFKAMVI